MVCATSVWCTSLKKQQGVADNTELQDSIRLSGRLQMTEKLLQALKPAKSAVTETAASAARGLEVLNEVDELQAEKNKLQQLLQTYQKEKKQRWNLGGTLNLQACHVCMMPD